MMSKNPCKPGCDRNCSLEAWVETILSILQDQIVTNCIVSLQSMIYICVCWYETMCVYAATKLCVCMLLRNYMCVYCYETICVYAATKAEHDLYVCMLLRNYMCVCCYESTF